VLLGSLERFIGALLEHYAGALPLWLAPVQVMIIPIKADVLEYGQKVKKALEEAGIRVELDSRNETLDKRIRQAEVEKIPYCLVIGGREAKQEAVSVRKKGLGDMGVMPVVDFVQRLTQELHHIQ
jgi:threonyl-tRNA synthetase